MIEYRFNEDGTITEYVEQVIKLNTLSLLNKRVKIQFVRETDNASEVLVGYNAGTCDYTQMRTILNIKEDR